MGSYETPESDEVEEVVKKIKNKVVEKVSHESGAYQETPGTWREKRAPCLSSQA